MKYLENIIESCQRERNDNGNIVGVMKSINEESY